MPNLRYLGVFSKRAMFRPKPLFQWLSRPGQRFGSCLDWWFRKRHSFAVAVEPLFDLCLVAVHWVLLRRRSTPAVHPSRAAVLDIGGAIDVDGA